MAKKTKSETKSKATSVVAKDADGGVQITFTIAFTEIEVARKKALHDLAKSTTVPGFRAGKAPLDKVEQAISQNKLLEQTLSYILPDLVGAAIKENDLKPALYPRFELVKAIDGEPWEVRAVTCELPEVELGEYKKAIAGASRADALWTPGKDEKETKLSLEEKENKVLKILLETIKVKIPKLLIDEEANSRLSQLLERIEKLGLTLESYLSSTGKTAEAMRAEYEVQAQESIALDLILNKIVETEAISATDKEVHDALELAGGQGEGKDPQYDAKRKQFIKSIILRRKALSELTNLI